jgi:hypothetical protein
MLTLRRAAIVSLLIALLIIAGRSLAAGPQAPTTQHSTIAPAITATPTVLTPVAYVPLIAKLLPTTVGPVPTATPTLPPPSYNNCQMDPNANAAPNYPIQITNINKDLETVTLLNKSTSAIDLTNWNMCSITGNQHHPIGGVINPGQSIAFPGPAGRIWNNTSADPGALYNPDGQLVSYFNS